MNKEIIRILLNPNLTPQEKETLIQEYEGNNRPRMP